MPGNIFEKIIIAAFISVFVAGCSHHKGLTKIKPEPERSAYSWYNDAMQELINHDYEKAAHSFTLLMEQHAGTIYAKKSLLRLGDLYFKEGEYRSAKTSFKEFLKRYQGDKLAEYAKFMIGYSDFRMRYDYKHSQKNAQTAASELIDFINSYPKSAYRLKAENMLSVLIDELEKHELYVAKFYLSIDKPVAAMIRLDYAKQRYDVNKLSNLLKYYRIKALLKLKKYKQAKVLINRLPKNNKYYKRLETVKN